MNRCPDCDTTTFVVNEEGCDVCVGCGLVRNGSVTFLPPSKSNKEEDTGGSSARPLPDNGVAKTARRNRHISSKDKWTAKLKELSSLAGLSDALSATAASIYLHAIEMPDWKNRKHDYQVGVLVACMFHACNIHKCHRTPAELCAVLSIDPRNARRMVKVTERAAEKVAGRGIRTTGTFVPTEILPRYAFRIESLPLNKLKEVRKLATEYYATVRKDIDNHRPDTITAGLLSVVVQRTGIDITDSEIANACLVAPNTVRSVSNRISAIVDSTPTSP